jgi:hypothetical protein
MRDELSQLVADNLTAILARLDMTPNALQTRINEAKPGNANGSLVPDFLKRNNSSSLTLKKLADLANALDIPPVGLLLPLDKRDELIAALRILGSLGPEEIDQAVHGIEGFFRNAASPATDERPEPDRPS